MQSARLLIRPIRKEDEISFISGISNNSLCAAYGFPINMETATARKIFTHFLNMGTAYSLIRINPETIVPPTGLNVNTITISQGVCPSPSLLGL